MTLTGRTCLRPGWFGRLVLQVEVAIEQSLYDRDGTIDRWTEYTWRDANIGDLHDLHCGCGDVGFEPCPIHGDQKVPHIRLVEPRKAERRLDR